MNRNRKYIFLALLTSGALILSLIESMIPFPFVAPGAKLGLPNMITLTVIVIFGFKSGMTVAVLRTILYLLVAGNVAGFLYSFSGAVLSTIIMAITYKYFNNYFSLIGISLFGALAHNTGQVMTAALMVQNVRIFSYLPIIYLVSLFTGCFVGYATIFIVQNLKKQSQIMKWS